MTEQETEQDALPEIVKRLRGASESWRIVRDQSHGQATLVAAGDALADAADAIIEWLDAAGIHPDEYKGEWIGYVNLADDHPQSM